MVRMELTIQGDLLKARKVMNWYSSVPPEKRGIVKGFTNPSRLRMLQAIAKIDWSAVGDSILITLTYPDSRVDRTYKQRTQDRSLFMRYVEEWVAAQVPAIWRVEWKPRQSGTRAGELCPHIHIVPLPLRFLPKEDIRRWWRTILGVTGPLATDVRRTNSGTHTAKYIAKYAAKQSVLGALDNDSYLNMTGRAWGWHRKSLIPWHREKTVPELTEDQIHRAMMVAAALLGRDYLGSFWITSPGAKVLAAQILGIEESELDRLLRAKR